MGHKRHHDKGLQLSRSFPDLEEWNSLENKLGKDNHCSCMIASTLVESGAKGLKTLRSFNMGHSKASSNPLFIFQLDFYLLRGLEES